MDFIFTLADDFNNISIKIIQIVKIASKRQDRSRSTLFKPGSEIKTSKFNFSLFLPIIIRAQDRQCAYNPTLWFIRVIIFAL